MLYIRVYFMRFILHFSFVIVLFTASSVIASQTLVKELTFEFSGIDSSPLDISSAIHLHAAEQYGAYFLVRKSESYNGGFNENTKIKRPLDVTIINYELKGATVNASVKLGYSALNETVDSYSKHITTVNKAVETNKLTLNALCKNIYEKMVETYFVSSEFDRTMLTDLVGGEDNLRLLESGNYRALMTKNGCLKPFDANFAI